MPTTAKRKHLHPTALRCWYEQTYPNKELIIVSEDDLSDVIPDHPNITVVKCDRSVTLGTKRNLGCAAAKGEFIAHWDDDDWYYSGRLAECVAHFADYQVGLVGYSDIRFFDFETKVARYFSFGNEVGWTRHQVCGTSMMYRKALWFQNKFRDINLGEDTLFQKALHDKGVDKEFFRMLSGDWKVIAGDHSLCTDRRREAYSTAHKFQVTPSEHTESVLNSYRSYKVVLGMLSWNEADLTIENLEALQKEAWRLKCFGHQPLLAVCDNASTDNTPKRLKTFSAKASEDIHLILNNKNLGCGGGKNCLIDYAAQVNADYLLLMDCDGTIVPGSVLEMLHWFKSNGAAGLGPKPHGCTADVTKGSKWCPSIQKASVYPFCATAGYGLFPVPLLSKFRFDTKLGPGWGGEDDDLACQIQTATGMLCYYFDDIVWVHRHPHNSRTHLKNDGMNVEANYQFRINYLYNKWKDVALVAPFVKSLQKRLKR